ncbi:hypothetical protein KIN20_034442 [Parelaphostrongylus tenuis]|uniref:Uncharacterized protein n=1 Tax=Parelaphostrongylus tenuis TaxID=148309 RepID=A0AAD5R9P0_PARTN|nr:hypothetical protein KIN20_034442 [Parelaphostrongylus tenuis]
MLGPVQVVSTNLKCDKRDDGQYLYEYRIQVCPDAQFEDVVGWLRFTTLCEDLSDKVIKFTSGQKIPNIYFSDYDVIYSQTQSSSHYTLPPSQGTSTVSSADMKHTSWMTRSSHFDVDCPYMVEVSFLLLHQNMNGKAQLKIKDEFPCNTTIEEVIEHFRIVTDGVHRGVFSPRLAYTVGSRGESVHLLTICDLMKTLDELCDRNEDFASIIIAADMMY